MSSSNGRMTRCDAGQVNGSPRKQSPSIALYSHDAMGVGHVRRNLLIAQALSQPPLEATSLLICGVHEAAAFTGGYGIDCLTLPSFEKHANDDYRPRELRMTSSAVTEIRAATLNSALSAMAPDLLIVDKVPMGLNGELKQVLPQLRAQGTRTVFGMRDVLDAPELVAREWRERGYERFICDHYDQVWVYGECGVFDPAEAYGFSSALRRLMRYTGYLDQRERLRFSAPLDTTAVAELGDLSSTVLCMLGGGEDGVTLAESFVRAELPKGRRGLLITGPLMPAAEFRRLQHIAEQRTDLRVIRQVRDADLLVAQVAAVVCMGGYNSMLSVVSFGKPALIVPRVRPRQEQLIRAELFERLGLVHMMRPDALSPGHLSGWMSKVPEHRDSETCPLDLGGLSSICVHASHLCHRDSGSRFAKSKIAGATGNA